MGETQNPGGLAAPSSHRLAAAVAALGHPRVLLRASKEHTGCSQWQGEVKISLLGQVGPAAGGRLRASGGVALVETGRGAGLLEAGGARADGGPASAAGAALWYRSELLRWEFGFDFTELIESAAELLL